MNTVYALVDFALARGENTVVCDVFAQAASVDVYRDLAAYHHARFVVHNELSWYKAGKIIECFCIDIDATRTALLLKLNRKTVNR